MKRGLPVTGPGRLWAGEGVWLSHQNENLADVANAGLARSYVVVIDWVRIHLTHRAPCPAFPLTRRTLYFS